MAEVIVFHHALGRTAGIEAFGNALAVAGHDVITPDLFDGATFETVEAGVAHAQSIGFEAIAEAGARIADQCGNDLTVIGFSLGVLPAQKIAQTRKGVAAAVLCHSALPLSVFGGSWPQIVALQLHMGSRDPFVEEDRDAIEELMVAAPNATLHEYDTAAHLVADVSSPDYDAGITSQLLARTLEFIGGH